MADEVRRYLEHIPSTRAKRFRSIHTLILGQYPEIKIDMQYKMPTYHANHNWVALANQTNYISLYTCDAKDIETFKKKHPKIKTGKTCINFRESDEVPLDDIAEVLASALDT